MLGLSTRAMRFTPPERFLSTPRAQAMATIAADVVDTINDVHSVEREEARGDVHNLVLVVQHERSCTRDEALAGIRDDIRTWIGRFLELTRELPGVYTSLGLTPSERAGADRYVEAMRTALRGYYDWSRRTDRYSAAGLIAADQPAYADLITTSW
jgi:pentalenene synthase/avermitilol synthase